MKYRNDCGYNSAMHVGAIPMSTLPMGAMPVTTMPANIMPVNTMPANIMPVKMKKDAQYHMPQLPISQFQASQLPSSQFTASQIPTGMPSAAPGIPLPPLPTGADGAAVPGMVSAQGWTQLPTTVESTLFTPGFLRTQIGRRVRVEFLIGTNNLTDRTGTLLAVGASYILIRPIESDDLMMCDLYSIKFVTIIL